MLNPSYKNLESNYERATFTNSCIYLLSTSRLMCYEILSKVFGIKYLSNITTLEWNKKL